MILLASRTLKLAFEVRAVIDAPERLWRPERQGREMEGDPQDPSLLLRLEG